MQLAGGVRAIQVREVEVERSVTACFFIIHDDGTDEDVSYRKCLGGIFADLKDLSAANTGGAQPKRGGGRGGGGRGGGGRGGGRGGRGRGGRGGRGRGRR